MNNLYPSRKKYDGKMDVYFFYERCQYERFFLR